MNKQDVKPQKKAQQNQGATIAQPNASNVDKIRDILFGEQAESYEKRFAQLENQLVKDSASLRDAVRVRMDALEAYIKHEIASVIERIDEEIDGRHEGINELTSRMEALGKTSTNRQDKLDSKLDKNRQDIRQGLLDQAKTFTTEISQLRDQLTNVLDDSIGELREDKASRNALAALFSELSMRLTGDFELPEE